ncbi:hypothetical protein B1B04_24855 [Lysinibacillus sp. KCTC 33748]|uniref:discoidin domain-containing protein n=1 Tax=unclassified Lysinibacillus TaxID=2636778 RepID=UPI0009A7FEEC|nr:MULTISPECIES: discoidin domain-containing protein [unclassified Lysinibacillus]OXS65740.1 hypothetical protein B1B04_24855 [Lysinibacillus sp. KCTC 33748]SKC19377.1 F5/8 type C domain-containing protein [Lysinibacillus sp. AC-3]
MVNYTDNIIPKMTSNSTNGFIATASSEYSINYQPWGAFDRGDNYWASSSGSSSGWISCEFPTPRKIIKFTIKNRIDRTSPKIFSFDGFDGVNWIVLFKEDSSPNWKDGEKREYYINNTNEYKRYRINISQSQSVGTYPEIAEIEMMEELIYKKTLLQSNNKTYSLESIDTWSTTRMTSNTAPSPLIASASSEYSTVMQAWRAFDGTISRWESKGNGEAWIQINFGKIIKVNKMTLRADGTYPERAPKIFEIQCSNDGVSFDTISSITDEKSWSKGESKEYHFNNNKGYSIYRLRIISNFNNATNMVDEIVFGYETMIIQTIPFTSKENFIKYGKNPLFNINKIITNKNYLLQDEVSKNEEGLLTTKLDRKPLSISFN